MSETTATIQAIHDTVRVAAQSQGVTIEQYVKGGIYTALSTGAVWLVRYFIHDRKKAKESAFVATTAAQQEADVKVTEAEARAQVAVQDSTVTIVQFWETQAARLDTLLTSARVELALLQSQAASSEKEKNAAEGKLEAAKERNALLAEENRHLRERIESDKEQLAELPALRNQAQTLLAKCELLQQELDEAIKLVQP